MESDLIGLIQWRNLNKELGFRGTPEEFVAAGERLAYRHPVYCAGCLDKGKRVQTGWSELKGTSINCDECNAEMKEETRRRFPGR